ncbi:hypothetical protein [Rhizosaccharibacter radicis]|uniref:Uncharacterized protein n=1 Tax=Rhizosaccharibacter radicis TaxID=2782605 RepID=A0ABT1VTG2_9PROT|nr:hypothetical protein [Acetobacteraceae bacterium KSS12]
MSDSIGNNAPPGSLATDINLENVSAQGRSNLPANRDVEAFHQQAADVPANNGRAADAQPRTFQTNPFRPNYRMPTDPVVAQALHAGQAGEPGPNATNVRATTRAGEVMNFNRLSGANNQITNHGETNIAEVRKGAELQLTGNDGRVVVDKNKGRIRSSNNQNYLGIKENAGTLNVDENKGRVKIADNTIRGDIQLGREGGVAGISQGGYPTQRHSGRVDVGSNDGTFKQHYGNASLGQALNFGGPTEITRTGPVHATPSGPGGKLRTPAGKTALVTGAGIGFGTTVGVGIANWQGSVKNFQDLANPTTPHTPTPTMTMPPTHTMAGEVATPQTSATPHMDAVSRTIGLDPDGSRPTGLSSARGGAAGSEVPHETAPKLKF